VIECTPTANVVAGRFALPPLSGTGAPRIVVPSLNWTVPVAEPGVTVAVRVTDCPNREGVTDDVTTTLEVTRFTT
jgi:hypothetical protein